MTLIQFLYHYFYFVVEMLDASLFRLVFPMLMAFASIMGCVRIIRYTISLHK